MGLLELFLVLKNKTQILYLRKIKTKHEYKFYNFLQRQDKCNKIYTQNNLFYHVTCPFATLQPLFNFYVR